MQVAGRAGMIARGVLHLLVALLVVEVVRNRPTEEAGAQGAIAAIARQPYGRILVGVITVGFFAYALWRGTQAVVGRDSDDAVWQRASAGARALLYAGLAVFASRTVINGKGTRGQAAGDSSSGSGSEQGQQATATVLSWPAGRVLVAAAGMGVLAAAAFNAYRAITREFEGHLQFDEMAPTVRTVTKVLGGVGYAGRALAYALTGGLLVLGAVQHDPSSGGGLDRALQRVAGAPYGQAVLLVLAGGLAAFGAYQLVEARYRDVAD